MSFKTFSATALFFISASALANSFNLHCIVKHDSQLVIDSDVVLGNGQRNMMFGEYNGFEFILSDNGNRIVELQSFNLYEPARVYATAKLESKGQFVEAAIWKREYLLEVRCTL
jgi:hypothetical protein